MPKSDRQRARLSPVDYVDYFKNLREYDQYPVPINRRAHNRRHANKVLTYTSTTTLSTDAGSPIYPWQPISLVSISLNVAGDTTSELECDLLLNGNSVFTAGYDTPIIPTGQSYSDAARIMGVRHVLPINHDYLQVQLINTGGATGPLVAYIQYRLVK